MSVNASLPVITTSTLATPRSSGASVLQLSRTSWRSCTAGSQPRLSLLAALRASVICCGGWTNRTVRVVLPSTVLTSQKLGISATGVSVFGTDSCETTNQRPVRSGTVPFTSAVEADGASGGAGAGCEQREQEQRRGGGGSRGGCR